MSVPEPRSVLTGHGMGSAPAPLGERRVTLQERACDAVEVAARRGRAEAVRAMLPPGTPELAPGLFLVVAPAGAPGALAEALADRLSGLASAVDLSSGLVALRLAGPEARAVLARGCRLDLHPRAFVPGQAARTIVAQVPTTLIQVDAAPTYDLFVPTTLALSFVEHLLDAAAPFGGALLPPEGRTGR